MNGCSLSQSRCWVFLFRFLCCAQCADGKVEALSDALQTTVAKWKGRIPMPLPLELYTSSTFIGLFVEEQVAEVLKSFAADFATEAAVKAGLNPFGENPIIHEYCLVDSVYRVNVGSPSPGTMSVQLWTPCIYCNYLLGINWAVLPDNTLSVFWVSVCKHQCRTIIAKLM